MDKEKQDEAFFPVLYCLRQSHLEHFQTSTSPTMQRFVEQLVAQHGLDSDAPDLNLSLVHPERNERLRIGALYEGTIMVARMVWVQGHWWEDPLMIFQVEATIWRSVEIRYSHRLWAAYVQYVETNNTLAHYDEHGQPLLAGITEYMAVQFNADDWLAKGQVQEVDEMESSSALWQMEKNEGITDSESAIWE